MSEKITKKGIAKRTTMCTYVWLVWCKDDVRNGAFELFSPWWMTKTAFCAAIPTASVAFAKSVVASAHRNPVCEHEMRWLETEVREGTPFSATFSKTKWMFWPGDDDFIPKDHREDVSTPETARASLRGTPRFWTEHAAIRSM